MMLMMMTVKRYSHIRTEIPGKQASLPGPFEVIKVTRIDQVSMTSYY